VRVQTSQSVGRRYTECRLQRLAEDVLLADLDPAVVEFTPNFDGSCEEPSVLPARLPQLLINGSQARFVQYFLPGAVHRHSCSRHASVVGACQCRRFLLWRRRLSLRTQGLLFRPKRVFRMQGIAVGIATKVPPHNLSEVVSAMKALISNPNASDEALHEHVLGPDFPTGGLLLSGPGVKSTCAFLPASAWVA
jgi:DNA gyrase subunit A